MSSLLWAVLLASLLGSLHCVGMCGGIVALCVGGMGSEDRSPRLLAAYNLGRLATYAGLGLISGGIGRAVDLGGGAVGLPRMAAVIAGALMIAAGLVALARTAGLRAGCLSLPGPLQRLFQRGMRAAMSLPPVRRSAVVGLLTGFLPCGWLYAFVAAAATTGDPLRGAAVMTAFWLGTVPALVAVGFGVRLVARPLQRHLPTVSAFCMLAVGVVAVVGRLNVPSYAGTVDARFVSVHDVDDVASITAAASETPACCQARAAAAGPSGGPSSDGAPEADLLLPASAPVASAVPGAPGAGGASGAPTP
jgi:sulfite exporter TauE/SafE